MWSLLGARPAQMVAWESFGAGWVSDVVKQLKIDASEHIAPYGEIFDMTTLNYEHDVCFTWNGTTSGVCMRDGSAIPADRAGLTLCDATSAASAPTADAAASPELPPSSRVVHLFIRFFM